MAEVPSSPSPAAIASARATSRQLSCRQGDGCVVAVAGKDAQHHGIIRFVGEIASLGEGRWIGVQHDEPVGNSNGKVNGRRIFDCPPKYGGFYRDTEITLQSTLAAKAAEEAEREAAEAILMRRGSLGKRGSVMPVDSSFKELIAFQEAMKVGVEDKDLLHGNGNIQTVTVVELKSASPEKSVASGRGLHTAYVSQVAQFTITSHDGRGSRREFGGDPFAVVVRGSKNGSKLRSRLSDHGNGSYTCEYKAEVSGELEIHITLSGVHIKGSPFLVTCVTLRAEAAKCVLQGEALNTAVARKQMAFDVSFVDSLGNPAVAEDLDVRVEKIEVSAQATSATLTAVKGDLGRFTYQMHGMLLCGEQVSRRAAPPAQVASPAGSFTKGHASATEDADPDEHSPFVQERLQQQGVLRLKMKSGKDLMSADLNGKSDPYVKFQSGEQRQQSSVRPKTLNPVWNEVYDMEGIMADFVNYGLHVVAMDCDNPLMPEEDDKLGEVRVSLNFLKQRDIMEFTESLGVDRGKLSFDVSWHEHVPESSAEDEGHPNIIPGDERVIIGSRSLLLRAGIAKDSQELLNLPPGTRVQLFEISETDEGYRAYVRVLQLPVGAVLPDVDQPVPINAYVGWITAAHKDGRRRLVKRHHKIDANEKRRQTALWNRRLAADKVRTNAVAADGDLEPEKKKKTSADAKVGPSFAHELVECERGVAFAYGGVYPGVLHARGGLIKTHQVHYSVGAAGKYLLHIGLRNQAELLPGSPFQLTVRPGPAHGPSTTIPMQGSALDTVVGTGGRMSVHLRDAIGNPCIEGDAPLQASVNTDSVNIECDDQRDGSYSVTWTGEKAGSFMLSLMLHGAHLKGSPFALAMLPAEIDVEACEIISETTATAGAPQHLQIVCRDAFGNEVDPVELPGLTFGVSWLALQSSDKPDKHMRVASSKKDGDGGDADKKHSSKESKKDAEKKLSREDRNGMIKTLPSIDFEGVWSGATYNMTYIPHEAGDFEVNVWCETKAGRTFLPGCPFNMQCKAGRASATGSAIREASMVTELIAGDRLVLKAQMCDEFGNRAELTAPDSDISAMLETPVNPLMFTRKPDLSANASSASENSRRDTKKGNVATVVAPPGAFEFVAPGELTVKGEYNASIQLHGVHIAGSPMQFVVQPASAIASKSYLELTGGPPVIDAPIDIILHLVDKYGNEVEYGGVRVDAKIFGSKASEPQIVDKQDGTYSVSFIASVPGDYKVNCRLELVEMAVLQLHVASTTGGADNSEASPDDPELEVSAPETPMASAPAPAATPGARSTRIPHKGIGAATKGTPKSTPRKAGSPGKKKKATSTIKKGSGTTQR